MFVWLVLVAGWAYADQLAWNLAEDGPTTTVTARWTDAAGRPQALRAEVPTAAIQADLEEPVALDLRSVNAEVATRVNAWARRTDTPVVARAKGASIEMEVEGTSRRAAERDMAEAVEVRDRARKDVLREHDLMALGDTGITADHPRLATRYDAALAGLATALAGGAAPQGDDDAERDARAPDPVRAYARRALGFVQSIPYRAGGDKRVRKPMGVIAKNKGDCDSKSTFYLALLHARYPELRTAMVYVPGHALVALDLPARPGDHVLQANGRAWVLVEPVGPGMTRIGEVGDATRKHLRKAQLVEVPH
jgi:hypothetical protein